MPLCTIPGLPPRLRHLPSERVSFIKWEKQKQNLKLIRSRNIAADLCTKHPVACVLNVSPYLDPFFAFFAFFLYKSMQLVCASHIDTCIWWQLSNWDMRGTIYLNSKFETQFIMRALRNSTKLAWHHCAEQVFGKCSCNSIYEPRKCYVSNNGSNSFTQNNQKR